MDDTHLSPLPRPSTRILYLVPLTFLPVLLVTALFYGLTYVSMGPAGLQAEDRSTDPLTIMRWVASKTVVPTLLIAIAICFLPRTTKGLRRSVLIAAAAMVGLAIIWGFLALSLSGITG